MKDSALVGVSLVDSLEFLLQIRGLGEKIENHFSKCFCMEPDQMDGRVEVLPDEGVMFNIPDQKAILVPSSALK